MLLILIMKEISKKAKFKFTQKETSVIKLTKTHINLMLTDGASCSTKNDDTTSSSSSGIAGGAIAGIVIGCIVVAVVVAAIIAFSAKSAQEGISNTESKCLSTDKMEFPV